MNFRRPLAAAMLGSMILFSSHPAIGEPASTERYASIHATSEVLAEALERFGGAGAETAKQARATLEKSRAARAAGRAGEADELAASAYALLREGVRASAAARPREEAPSASPARPASLPPGYSARREAALELRKAVVRVAAEKGLPASGVTVFDARLTEADAHAAVGRGEEASGVLAAAYETIKSELVALRNGETLVRSLHFETAEQEYRYELDRNDTFAMLVRLLADEVPDEERVAAFLAEAGELRGAANAAGARGEFSQGIRLLEESTRAFLKVMRSAGLLIPG